VHTIRTVRDSINRYANISREHGSLDVPAAERVMVSNRSFDNFRVTTVPASWVSEDIVNLSPEVAEALQIESGDLVRLAPLKDEGRIGARKE